MAWAWNAFIRAWNYGAIALCGSMMVAMLAIAGCGPRTTAPDADSAATKEAAEAAELQSNRQCITGAVNDAVLKVQDDAATQAALDGQDLTNCPTDFVSAFVALRTSVRNYLQTQHEIIAHNGQANDAAGGDLLNLGCSVIAGKQCAPSAIVDWVNIDGTLKSRDAANRAAYQTAMADLETVIARYGVYIRKAASPPEPGNTSASSDESMK